MPNRRHKTPVNTRRDDEIIDALEELCPVINLSNLCVKVCYKKPYPGQLAVAGKLPAGQVGGTLVVVQNNVCSFWISSKIELATHCGISSSFMSKAQKTTDELHHHIMQTE